MKQLLLISFLATSLIWAIAQPPKLDDISENSSNPRPDTATVDGTHTTARERQGLPEDSVKTAKTSKKVVHKSSSTHKKTTASTKSSK